MSVLLLTNPFANQPPPPNAPALSAAQTGSALIGAAAVTPPKGSSAGSHTGSSTSYSGSGSGAGGSGAQQPVYRPGTISRLSTATPSSVINAQTSDQAPPDADTTQLSPIARMAADRDAAETQGADAAAEVLNLSEKRTEIAGEMPDPLPTSPFLKGAKGA